MSQAIHKPIKRKSKWHSTLTKFMRYTFFALFCILSIALYLSLATYHPNDPAYTSAVQNSITHNWLGMQGAYYSDITFTLFDRVAWIIPLIMVIYAYQLIIKRKIIHLNVPKLSIRLTGILFFIIILSALLDLASASGGVVGKGVANFLVILCEMVTSRVTLIFNPSATAFDIGPISQRISQIILMILSLISLRFAIGNGPLYWCDYFGDIILKGFYYLRGITPPMPIKEGDALATVEHLMEKPPQTDLKEKKTVEQTSDKKPDGSAELAPVSELIHNLEKKQNQTHRQESYDAPFSAIAQPFNEQQNYSEANYYSDEDSPYDEYDLNESLSDDQSSHSAFDDPQLTNKTSELNQWANSSDEQREPSFDSLVTEQTQSLQKTFSASRSIFNNKRKPFNALLTDAEQQKKPAPQSNKRFIPIDRGENIETAQLDDSISIHDKSPSSTYNIDSLLHNLEDESLTNFSTPTSSESLDPELSFESNFETTLNTEEEPTFTSYFKESSDESRSNDPLSFSASKDQPLPYSTHETLNDEFNDDFNYLDDREIGDHFIDPFDNEIQISVEDKPKYNEPDIHFTDDEPTFSVNFDDEEILEPTEPTIIIEEDEPSFNPFSDPFTSTLQEPVIQFNDDGAIHNEPFIPSFNTDHTLINPSINIDSQNISVTRSTSSPSTDPHAESQIQSQPKTPPPSTPNYQPNHQPITREPNKQEVKTEPRENIYEKFPMYGRLPGLDLLGNPPPKQNQYDDGELQKLAGLIEEQLKHYNINVTVAKIEPGPVITRFRLELAPGVKVAQINNLSRDIARALSVTNVRVQDIIPGTPYVGLEVPNAKREVVHFKEGLFSKEYRQANHPLSMILGQDISGREVVANLAKMPHLLVAGTTGSGKSVGINTMLLSLLFKARPDELRLILIDPKMLELSVYNDIPHLLAPVVTDMKESANALRWCVAEMECRYQLMSEMKTRNIAGYNEKVRKAIKSGEPLANPLWNRGADLSEFAQEQTLEPMPYIVVVIDEFADMMMLVGKQCEELIARLAQKARAAGIHLILATQRPSVDVITGLIKANIPARIAFQVSSRIDSRTIIDQQGAETLLGNGDMLYFPPGAPIPQRVHGAFIDDHEVNKVVDFLKLTGRAEYIEGILSDPTEPIPGLSEEASGVPEDETDVLYDEAVKIVVESRRASISYLQRRLRIGYNRAARMMDDMERQGFVSEPEANGSREVLIASHSDDH